MSPMLVCKGPERSTIDAAPQIERFKFAACLEIAFMQINQIFSRQAFFSGSILGVEVFDQYAIGLFFYQSEPVVAIVDQAADGSQDFSQTAGI
jgi:hypothetical protein